MKKNYLSFRFQFLILLSFFSLSAFANLGDTIVLADGQYSLEQSRKRIYVSEDLASIQKQWPNEKLAIRLGNDVYRFKRRPSDATKVTSLSNAKAYRVYGPGVSNTSFRLYFKASATTPTTPTGSGDTIVIPADKFSYNKSDRMMVSSYLVDSINQKWTKEKIAVSFDGNLYLIKRPKRDQAVMEVQKGVFYTLTRPRGAKYQNVASKLVFRESEDTVKVAKDDFYFSKRSKAFRVFSSIEDINKTFEKDKAAIRFGDETYRFRRREKDLMHVPQIEKDVYYAVYGPNEKSGKFIVSFADEQDIIKIANGQYGVNHKQKVIVVNTNIDTLKVNYKNNVGAFLLGDQIFRVQKDLKKGTPLSGNPLKYGKQIEKADAFEKGHEAQYYIYGAGPGPKYDKEVTYHLSFTDMPIITINSSLGIRQLSRQESRRNRVSGNLVMRQGDGTELSSDIYVGLRGATSMAYRKKSLRLTFVKDNKIDYKKDSNKNKVLISEALRKSDEFNLQSAYVEPLRINTKMSYELWTKMYTPHYIDKKPKAVSSPRIDFAEVNFNGEYLGLYNIGERVNRNLLQLEKYDEVNKEMQGILIKADEWSSSTTYYTASKLQFKDGVEKQHNYEWKAPKKPAEWRHLTDFLHPIADHLGKHGNGKPQMLYDFIDQKFIMKNLVDYFIFIQVLSAEDNKGKNIYTVRQAKGDKFFYVPWDLDGTWGHLWHGGRRGIDVWHYNGIFEMLLGGNIHEGKKKSTAFFKDVQKRWVELSKTTLRLDELEKMVTYNHDLLFNNGAYFRHDKIWGSSKKYGKPYVREKKMKEWLKERLDYLNKVLSTDVASYTRSIADDDQAVVAMDENEKIILYPNPANNFISLDFNNEKYEAVNVEIFDLMGRSLLSKEMRNSKESISLQSLNSGLYLVQVRHNGAVIHQEKIVVTK